MNLWVFVTGGGLGFQYGFSFDKTVDEDDTCIEKQGANLVIDSLSLQYLQGSTVDYVEDLTGSKFIISNPNVQSPVVVESPSLFDCCRFYLKTSRLLS